MSLLFFFISIKAKVFPVTYKALHSPLRRHLFMLPTAVTLASLGASSVICSTLLPQALALAVPAAQDTLPHGSLPHLLQVIAQ